MRNSRISQDDEQNPSLFRTVEGMKKQFVYLATEISNHFPELDLRFNLRTDTGCVRCIVPEHAKEAFEFSLEEAQDAKRIIVEAVFAIKQLTAHFDS